MSPAGTTGLPYSAYKSGDRISSCSRARLKATGVNRTEFNGVIASSFRLSAHTPRNRT